MAPSTRNGFNIQISLFIAPENVPKFFDLFQPVYESTVAEPECVFFEAYQSREDPGHIRLVESWFVPPSARMQLSLTDIRLGTPP